MSLTNKERVFKTSGSKFELILNKLNKGVIVVKLDEVQGASQNFCEVCYCTLNINFGAATQ